MGQIVYRNLKEEDYPAVADILSQAFGLHRYVSDPRLLQIIQQQYIYSCLSEATFARIAEEYGQIIGVIMGNARSDYQILRHFSFLLRSGWYGIKMKLLGRKGSTGIDDYNKLHQIYHIFSKRHKREFDGVLTLFAVNDESRGKGVGKTLLSELISYWKEHKTRNVYLYTDTTCNYGFYEHQDFVRLEEEPLVLTRDGVPFEMQVFLYGYKVG
jgi:ribosomal protein S18 acetylase RimI-like enzyme